MRLMVFLDHPVCSAMWCTLVSHWPRLTVSPCHFLSFWFALSRMRTQSVTT